MFFDILSEIILHLQVQEVGIEVVAVLVQFAPDVHFLLFGRDPVFQEDVFRVYYDYLGYFEGDFFLLVLNALEEIDGLWVDVVEVRKVNFIYKLLFQFVGVDVVEGPRHKFILEDKEDIHCRSVNRHLCYLLYHPLTRKHYQS